MIRRPGTKCIRLDLSDMHYQKFIKLQRILKDKMGRRCELTDVTRAIVDYKLKDIKQLDVARKARKKGLQLALVPVPKISESIEDVD